MEHFSVDAIKQSCQKSLVLSHHCRAQDKGTGRGHIPDGENIQKSETGQPPYLPTKCPLAFPHHLYLPNDLRTRSVWKGSGPWPESRRDRRTSPHLRLHPALPGPSVHVQTLPQRHGHVPPADICALGDRGGAHSNTVHPQEVGVKRGPCRSRQFCREFPDVKCLGHSLGGGMRSQRACPTGPARSLSWGPRHSGGGHSEGRCTLGQVRGRSTWI